MKVLMAVGKSGGHIFPALSLAHCLDERLEDIRIFFVSGGAKLEKKIFSKEKYVHFTVQTEAMPYKISPAYVRFTARLSLALIRSWWILGRVRPDIVVGFGGAASGPLVFAACLRRIPTIIHEQNIIPGRTNKILANFVDVVAISFSETKKFFQSKNLFKPARVVLTGNPIRKSRPDKDRSFWSRELGLDGAEFTILVIGGSQGSSQLNELAWQVFSRMEKENSCRVRIIHITGEDDYQKIKERYRQIKFSSLVFSFYDRLNDVYSSSDLVLSRAGASTISEITAYGLASILIPYRFAISHQLANARMLADRGAAILIEEEKVSPEYLKRIILDLIKNKAELDRLAENSKRTGRPQADGELADQVMRLVKQ